MQSNEYYQILTGIDLEDINAKTERFREAGTFCGEVGDLVIKVCSDILRVAIVIIIDMAGSPLHLCLYVFFA